MLDFLHDAVLITLVTAITMWLVSLKDHITK